MDALLAAIPGAVLIAAGLALLATMGLHFVAASLCAPRGTLLTDAAATVTLYVVGTVLCAALTYWAWQDFSPPASAAASAAWGLAHPVVTRAAVWVAGKRWPGLVQSVRSQQ